MTGVITTGNHPKELWPGVHSFWGENYDEYSMECNELFDWRSSTKQREEIVERTGMGLAPVKAQGQAASFDSSLQGVVNTFTHVAYALGGVVTYESLRDNQYLDKAKEVAGDIGFSMRQTKEQVSAQTYNRAFTAGYTFGDGQILCVSTHPTRSGNQSNVLSVAADLSEQSLEDMCNLIGKAKNARNHPVKLIPQKLFVAVDNQFEAERILKSMLTPDSANNAINAIKSKGMLPQGYTVNHYFTDVDAWFVRTNARDGMVGFDRETASYEQDNDFDTKNAKALGYMRFSLGVGDWRGIYGTPGA